MKRIVAFICALCLFCSIGYAKDLQLDYYMGVANPNLELPGPKKAELKNGVGLIEAEDCALSKNTTLTEDAAASEGMAVTFSPEISAKVLEDSEEGPTLKAEFEVVDDGTYNVWALVKPVRGGNSLFCAFDNEAYVQKNFTESSEWVWYKIGSAPLDEGSAYLSLKYRQRHLVIDKFLFTTDLTYTPIKANDMPKPMLPGEGVANLFPEPEIKPVSGHPRVFLTPEYIEKLKVYIKSDEIAPAWAAVKKIAEQNLNSELPKDVVGNYDTNILNWVQCRALLYALGEKDEAWAKETIRHASNILRTVTFLESKKDVTREKGEVMVMGAVVYDWCYDYMTDEDKSYFIKRFKQICSIKEIGYPPSATLGGIGGHVGETEIHRDMLSCGIACYDEDPEMYNIGAGALLSRFVESRKLFNKSGNHPEGSAYGLWRLTCELYADLMFTRMGYPSIYGEEIESVMIRYLYARRPDGLVMVDGDDYAMGQRNRVVSYTSIDWEALIMLNALYDDPYVRGQFMKELSMKGYSSEAFWLVICADPDKPFSYTDDLPTAYQTTYPLTSVFHRTSWQAGLDSTAAMAQFKAYEVQIADHMHMDAGSFQIYYKGALATDTGCYGTFGNDHDYSYYKRSIAHNVVTVYDPNEKFIIYNGREFANDGGQRFISTLNARNVEQLMSDDCHYADTKGTYIGPNEKTPAFSYLKSDLTPAYTDKVKSYNRSMVFVDLFDENYPAAFVVFDNVTSSDKTFDKKWLLHSVEEPKVDGNTTTIARTQDGYNGKLVNKTFMPSSFNIEKVGGDGNEFFVDGKNYAETTQGIANAENGKWRIELSPKADSENDIFLNAMYVTDNDKNLPELPMYQESMSGFVGVTVKDRMVLLAKDTKTKTNTFSITVRDNGYSDVTCFIADTEEGIWNVSGDVVNINVESKSGEGVLCFNVKPGNYTISKTDALADELVWLEAEKEKSGDFIVYNSALRGFVRCELPNKLVNDVAYVPLKAMFKQFGATVEWDATRECAVAKRGANIAEIYPQNSSYSLNGSTIPLSVPTFVENGVMYVPVVDFKDFLKFNVKYDNIARILDVSIVAVSSEISSKIDIENDAIAPVSVTASGNDGNVETNVNDYALETRWSCEGNDTWLEYDLGASYDISKLWISFYKGSKRKTIFDIEFSNDGVNYTKVYSGESSGATEELEEFAAKGNARFVRFIGHGTNVSGNYWNSVNEMIVSK